MNGRIGIMGILLTAAIAASGCATIRRPPFTPLQLSITPGAEVFARETPVYGVSVNAIYGAQNSVTGLSAGPMNEVKALTGIEAGVVNVARTRVRGIQVGAGNAVEGLLEGLQVAAVNQLEGKLRGAQLGVGNTAGEGMGLQVGLVNHARSLKGLQLGLINVNESGLLPFLPFFNVGF